MHLGAHAHGLVLTSVLALALTGCASPHTPVIEDPGTPTTLATAARRPGEPAPTVVPADRPGAIAANGVVVKTVDGDTLDVHLVDALGGRTERVRLLGVDTPETKRPDTPVECFGHEAADATARLLPVGTPVRLERDVELRDRYGRLLAYARRADDGLFVNLELVRTGYAAAYPFPPNVAHRDELAGADAAARAAGAGLWARCGGGHVPLLG